MYTKLVPGRVARPLAATIAAALLAGLMVIGCWGSNASAATTTANPAPASLTAATITAGSLTFPTGTSTCYEWSGVDNLLTSALPLQQLASDQEIYGPGSDPVGSDEMALSISQMGLSQIITQLPESWAQAIQDQVLDVGGASTPDQLDTAAGNASSLANTISGLCYTP
jgi:hypothetical protein